MEYVQMERLSIKSHAELGEKWVQERIADDPSIIGLGDVIMKDKERLQPRAGRLDLLLQDVESNRRYEVEVQLGKTDESHIIRTIEYWDIERKRYPQYDHTAVIVAEKVTSRFLNVISLFNGVIPLIAVQMSAFRLGDQVSLVFTTVLDQVSLGFVDEDEEVSEVADRGYWEKRGTPATVKIADELFEIVQQVDSGIELKYNKFYIGMSKDEKPHNFVVFRPHKSSMQLTVRLEKSEQHEQKIEESGLDLIDYNDRQHGYRIRIKKGEVKNRSELLRDLFAQAHKELGL
jgi:hypothetical protein